MCLSSQSPFLLKAHLQAQIEHEFLHLHHELYRKYDLLQLMPLFLHRSLPFFQMFLVYHEHWLKDQDCRLDLVDSHILDPFELQQEDYLIPFRLYIFYFQATLTQHPNVYLLQAPKYLVALHYIQKLYHP